MTASKNKLKHPVKSKKKINSPSKAGNRQKKQDNVCLFDEVILTEPLYCCEDECCCPV